ncbi:MAG: hypothetical protein QOH47_2950 [Sphingomonadales bacterium]|jgi:hypothetical protein|nr:hypothetical protein [Sphingomonadales bacterium]
MPSYDARGNVESAGSSTYYTYSADNMLTSSWGQASLSYDPLHRLFQVSGATTTRMLYDGATLIAEEAYRCVQGGVGGGQSGVPGLREEALSARRLV